jgi:asparagine synthase (glutamine-hydrolysing)
LTGILRPDPLEIHSGVIAGVRRTPPPPPPPASGAQPRAVLDDLLVEALQRQPCHVAFSGGRDSSVILAAAVSAARRHGLPDPIPLTSRYPQHPNASESEWQELVVRHLGLRDWTIFDVTTELDALGDIATGILRRHGIYWPSNGHSMALFARKAGGGTLLTGSGGDEMFTAWPGRRVPLRSTIRRRPLRRAVKWSAYYNLPGRTRHAIAARRIKATIPWLRPDAHARVNAALRENNRYAPTWGEAIERLLESRYYELVRDLLDTLAADEGVELVEPLYDPRFVQAVIAHGPVAGFESRGRALEAMFGDLLPREVLYRGTKAHFNEVAWGPGARGFAEAWDGTGVDTDLVDPVRLREEWLRPRPDVRCLGCLHHAWLATA